ncbi:MAG TPA: adenylate/guanylate cyclase domain-containing protein [Rectinemataceae bacterium]|nr:adenylate/guanylate cyclase domain-containing protein [Rectinemataceae bacterium]
MNMQHAAPSAAPPSRSPGAPSVASKIDAAIESLDKPLLLLSVLAVVLYLLELKGIATDTGIVRVLSLLVDACFVVDVLLKLAFRRGRYLRSAWFMTDLLSCLPGILLVANVPWLQAIQFARLFRVLRVLRGLRVLRSLQFLPSLSRAAMEEDGEGRRFRVGMNLAVTAYAAGFIAVLAWMRSEFGADAAFLDEAEFFLILGALMATALFLFLIHGLLRDASWNQLRTLLNIALPAQVAEHFLHHPAAYKERHRGPATILFIDFVGFSSTAEKMRDDVGSLAEHLERVMDAVVERLVAHDLIIDKFIGDAVMSFRGGPLVSGDPVEHARRVVRAALEAAGALRDLGDPYFSRVKIGCASDECLIGAFGTSKRLSYTVLGDGVNLAARLEPASGQCGAQALFCDVTRRLCGELPGISWRRWGTIRVKGKAAPELVWEAFENARLPDLTFIELYERARASFEEGDLRSARSMFLAADAARSGGDPPSRLHLDWCGELLEKGATKLDPVLSVMK